MFDLVLSRGSRVVLLGFTELDLQDRTPLVPQRLESAGRHSDALVKSPINERKVQSSSVLLHFCSVFGLKDLMYSPFPWHRRSTKLERIG